VRHRIAASFVALAAAAALTACGSEGVDVSGDEQVQHGAELFAERCSGCHTLTAAGAQGTGEDELRAQGPNLDQRAITYEDALYAIQNGGFSGSIMPQQIVTGDDAEAVAAFIEEYSGSDTEG
jgi:mono/diheme cytochrome c family protein